MHKGISYQNGEFFASSVAFLSQKSEKVNSVSEKLSAVVIFVNIAGVFEEVFGVVCSVKSKESKRKVLKDVEKATGNVVGKDLEKVRYGSVPPSCTSCTSCDRAVLIAVNVNDAAHDVAWLKARSLKSKLALALATTANDVLMKLMKSMTKSMMLMKSMKLTSWLWLTLAKGYFTSKVHVAGLLLCAGDVHPNPGPDGSDGPDVTDGILLDDGIRNQSRNDVAPSVPRQNKSELQVVSLNVRGLGDSKKVRHLINTCYKMTKVAANSLFLFQETYVPKLDLLRYLWRGEYKLTMGTGNSLGCITLVTAPYKIVHSVEIGQRGHVLALSKDDPNKVDAVVANVYAPNGFDNEKRLFFEELFDCINEVKNTYNCSKLVVAGDFNIVLNDNEVKNRSYPIHEKRLAEDVKMMIQQADLSDGWVKSSLPSYTWTSSRSGQQSYSTLDRILFSTRNLTLQHQRADWSLSLSDHAAVIATYNEVKSNNTNFIPRLDPRLLLDPEGREVLDATFREMFDQQSGDWNPHVRLEYGKMCIRTAANMATSKIKSRYRDEERILNNDINFVTIELAKEPLASGERELLMHKLDDLRQLKRSLVERIGAKLERRNARKWYNEGELSSKYFFNLLSRKANDEINIVIKDGDELTDSKDIEEEIRSFYKDLYETLPANLNSDDQIFRHIQPVTPEAAATMNERLTLAELELTLKTCDDSAPGPDGIPYSYIKHFWRDLGPVILDSWNYSIESKQLPPSHKVSYLRLIPKTGKDCRVIANLRPITLSNTDHKLITKTYAKKLTHLMSEVIGNEQTAYIPGRLINDNVRSLLATIDLANVDDTVDGVILSLDAKKAFDSVDHRYIRRCLKAFGLDCFVHIFDTLYTDLSSKIILNGKVVDGYSILKGVKQGDALSCILFIICMEPLIRNIKHNNEVENITSAELPIQIPKVYGFADDITIAAKRSVRGVQSIFDEYEAFSKESGLILNADKTDVLCFNKDRTHDLAFDITYLGEIHHLRGLERIKVNGIFLLQDAQLREVTNVERAVTAMERHLSMWSTRNLTLLGRILIVKTFAVSQIIYLMQSMSLSESSYKAVTKVVYKYLWNRNFNAARAPERLKRSIMTTPVKLGGFGMINLSELGESLDLRSYGRLIISEHPFFKQVKDLVNCDDFFNVELESKCDRKATRSIELLNRKRKKVLSWPINEIVKSASLTSALLNIKLSKIITRQGRQSLHFLNINRRAPQPTLGQLAPPELRVIERFIIYPELAAIVRSLVRVPLAASIDTNSLDAYPNHSLNVVNIVKLTSRELRMDVDEADSIICLYKLGLALNPGEVISWTNKMRKLTSTRHKNILLRVAHGDIFSNSRLFKFGLRDNPKCANCPEATETVLHRLCECPLAIECWEKLEDCKRALGMNIMSDLSVENLLGAKDILSKVELALNAELLLKLSTRSNGYMPEQLVRSTVRLIGNSEWHKPEIRQKFKELETRQQNR